MSNKSFLSYLVVVLTFIAALVGIFYTFGGERFIVENIYGESIELYGDGIYKYNSVLKAMGNKGTDMVMLIVAFLFALFTVLREKSSLYRLLQIGTLTALFYYSSCLVFGVTFNSLFPVYVMLFSSSLFLLISLLSEWIKESNISEKAQGRNFRGTALFIIISGCSVLVWLEFILPAVMSAAPLSNIEIYTTEATFVLDLGIILPVYIACGIALLRKKEMGYKLTPILLIFITIIGLTVIGQNIYQTNAGVMIPQRQFFTLVISFAVLGIIATFLNIRFVKYLK